jgi:hypothetical protein
MTPDIERLRRFSLATALMLIAYVAAGVQLQLGAHISVFGMPFIIRRPEFLPLCLLLASIYGLIRYFYYGVMLQHTPYRCRKDLLQKLHAYSGDKTYNGSAFFGPSVYSTTSRAYKEEVERQLLEVISSFPKFWNIRVIGKINTRYYNNEDGEAYANFDAEIRIPIACRLTALFQDIDYTAPIWLNLVALSWAAIAI